MPNLIDNKEPESSPRRSWFHYLGRGPLGLPVFELFVVFVFLVGLAVAVALPLVARLFHVSQ